MLSSETIVALSSAPGVAARAIVRLSGSMAANIAGTMATFSEIPGAAQRCVIHISSWKFYATIYLFRAPRSYTGEDLIEFHLPARFTVVRAADPKHAQAAEGAGLNAGGSYRRKPFSTWEEMDLTQAEGVAATIAALNQRELTAARQLAAGELARRTAPITELIAEETLALVEAGIDFVDEDVSFISSSDVVDRLNQVDQMLGDLVEQSARFGPIGAEPTVVLIGRPNAGKSTLLNALAKSDRAIVSPVAGTTRDALSAEVVLSHGIVKMIDVAGIDESHSLSDIDQQMQAQACRTAESADVIINVNSTVDAAVRSISAGLPTSVFAPKPISSTTFSPAKSASVPSPAPAWMNFGKRHTAASLAE